MDRWGKGREIGGRDYGEGERGGLLRYGKRGMPWRYEDAKEDRFYSVREGVLAEGEGWAGVRYRQEREA